MDFTLLTCNYDTPYVTSNMVKSYLQTSSLKNHPIFVMDTSPKSGILEESSDYIIHDLPNATHGEAVNLALTIITTKHVLLVDSDILFTKDIAPIYKFCIDSGAALLGHVSGDRGGKSLYPRVDPWFCLMDVSLLKHHNITFFDPTRTKASRKSVRVYDIGSTMFEDVGNAGLTVADIPDNSYCKHYEGMSWRTKKYNPNLGDTDIDFGGTHNNKALYEYGRSIEKQYMIDVKDL